MVDRIGISPAMPIPDCLKKARMSSFDGIRAGQETDFLWKQSISMSRYGKKICADWFNFLAGDGGTCG